VEGPDGRFYAFATYVSTELVDIEPDEEQRKQHVTRVQQQQDKAVLRVLDLTTGDTATHQRDAVYTFLQPWLSRLADEVLGKYRPLYCLDPEDWEIDVVMRIGQDKQLPGATFPGLALPQQHRVFALWRALNAFGRTAINGEPGTGKTRIHIALMALFAHLWQEREGMFRGRKLPRWVKRLRRAWKANPHAGLRAPRAAAHSRDADARRASLGEGDRGGLAGRRSDRDRRSS
jgi:hypothetical protein